MPTLLCSNFPKIAVNYGCSLIGILAQSMPKRTTQDRRKAEQQPEHSTGAQRDSFTITVNNTLNVFTRVMHIY